VTSRDLHSDLHSAVIRLTKSRYSVPVTKRVMAAAALSLALIGSLSAAKTLEIFFIDVEGGESTLIVTAAGESLLIDAGYAGRGGRDPARILAAAREAHLDHIDYLLITHFHPDHVGGVPELAALIPIGTFIDYGEPLGTDRMSIGGFRNYESLRGQHVHLQPKPGDRLPLKDVDADIASAAGVILSKPLREGGQKNAACTTLEDQPDDGTENFRSVGLRLRFGRFRFVDLGDLSGNTLGTLGCPVNLLGEASVYLVPHHGNYDSNVPAVIAAVRPRVAIMNNGATKGGAPAAFATLRQQPGLEDLWQLHASRNQNAENSAEAFIANVDEGQTSYGLKLTALNDGSFTVTNDRNGFSKTYPAKVSPNLAQSPLKRTSRMPR
jgi:beta-lactamase superfamily II metal-dependent hydrolase